MARFLNRRVGWLLSFAWVVWCAFWLPAILFGMPLVVVGAGLISDPSFFAYNLIRFRSRFGKQKQWAVAHVFRFDAPDELLQLFQSTGIGKELFEPEILEWAGTTNSRELAELACQWYPGYEAMPTVELNLIKRSPLMESP